MKLSDITGIIGRNDELKQLTAALEKQRPTVLIGREGIGNAYTFNRHRKDC
jgi:MoxR-like ATPase